jgi:uncharacterized RDD family membrane protein YckC
MSDRRFGGFWRRFLAFFIDQVLLNLITWILYLIGLLALQLAGAPFGHASALGGLRGGTGTFTAIYTFVTIITAMIYFTGFHGTFGQTPGKMLFGLRVIQVSGEPMTIEVAFLRWVGTLISGLVLGLGYLWIAFDGRKQGWHDKIAATLVMRTGNTHAAVTQTDPAMATPAVPTGSPLLPASSPAVRMTAPDVAPMPPLTDGEVTPATPAPAPLPEGEHTEETRGTGVSPSI